LKSAEELIVIQQGSISHPEFSGQIGIGRVDITPPPGIFTRSWGSSTHDVATGVHKPLYASCVMFRGLDVDFSLYLLSLDLCFWGNQDESEIRSQILEQSGLAKEQLILHLSHTHSAPRTDLQNVGQPGGDLIQPWRDKIVAGSVSAIEEARNTAEKSFVTWVHGTCKLAHNRDQAVEEAGELTTIVGLNLECQADDTLLVGRIVDTDDNIRAVLVNYACHPVSLGGGNTEISPDYVGKMREVVEAEIGDGICVFLHGASGDLTPRLSYASDPAVADQNGLEIGYAVLETLASSLPVQSTLAFDRIEQSGAPLGRWELQSKPASTRITAEFATVELAFHNLPSLEELDNDIRQTSDRYMLERLQRRRQLRDEMGDSAQREINIPIWRIGDSVIVALPAEAYSEFQQSLRKMFPASAIVVLNIANGYFSYLPTRESYDVPDLYQVRVALFEAGCMEKVLASTQRVIGKLDGNG
jgi:hypothetical protein